MRTFLAIIVIAGIPLASILIANLLFDRKIPNYQSRKVGHLGAGLAFLLSPLLTDTWQIPFGIALVFMMGLLLMRLYRPTLSRGVGGSGRPNSVAELWFPLVCAIAIFVGWGGLGSPWLGVLPCLFVGFGDAVTGAIRSLVYKKETKGWAGSAAMLFVCAICALLVHPYWIGLAGAVTATFFEKITKATPRWDDNPSLTLSSTAVMGLLYWAVVA